MPQPVAHTREHAVRAEPSGTHDTLIYRLAQMFYEPNLGESLKSTALVQGFGVNPRTIRRNLNERFAYLPQRTVDCRANQHQVSTGKQRHDDFPMIGHTNKALPIRALLDSTYPHHQPGKSAERTGK